MPPLPCPGSSAVPSRGGTPLPRDPFEMTGEPEGLGSATLQELRVSPARCDLGCLLLGF